jgi:TrkA domain protein
LLTEQIPIQPSSPYVGRTLGDTRIRTRTSASLVAVLREREVIPSPPPSFAFEAGDIVVVVGTRKALAEVTRILADDDPDG